MLDTGYKKMISVQIWPQSSDEDGSFQGKSGSRRGVIRSVPGGLSSQTPQGAVLNMQVLKDEEVFAWQARSTLLLCKL